MPNCLNCGKNHDGTYGSGNFCCRSCSNKRQHSEETKDKIRNSVNALILKHPDLFKGGRGKHQSKETKEKVKNTWNNKILNIPFEDLTIGLKRKRVFLEQEGCCNMCGNSLWLGKSITLELEHIDGDNQNYSRNNLKGLCPNCHSQTDTWRGRNQYKGPQKTKKELYELYLKNDKSIQRTLRAAGYSAWTGGNYQKLRVAILEAETNIPR